MPLFYATQTCLEPGAIGDRWQEGNALEGLGKTYHKLGEYSQANEFFQQALTLGQETNNRNTEATMLANLGKVAHSSQQYSQASDLYQQALAIAQEIGAQELEQAVLNNIEFLE
ncbi:MAG: tetratricopeptide repeat protein [Phormidesmis sp.]